MLSLPQPHNFCTGVVLLPAARLRDRRMWESFVPDAWYYADTNGQVGPLTLQKLKETLSTYLEHNPVGLNQYRKGRDSQTRSDRRVLPDRMIRGTSDAEGLFPGLA